MAHTPEHIDRLNSVVRAKGFVGREFLTWVWYVAENQREGLAVTARDGKTELAFDLWIGDRLVLEASSGLSLEHAIKGGDPSQSREAHLALANGKTVRDLKIVVAIKGYGEFSTVLRGDDLNPRSLKLPKPDDGGEGVSAAGKDDLPLALRIKQTEAFLSVLDGLFSKFLMARSSEDWEKRDLKAIQTWIEERETNVEKSSMH